MTTAYGARAKGLQMRIADLDREAIEQHELQKMALENQAGLMSLQAISPANDQNADLNEEAKLAQIDKIRADTDRIRMQSEPKHEKPVVTKPDTKDNPSTILPVIKSTMDEIETLKKQQILSPSPEIEAGIQAATDRLQFYQNRLDQSYGLKSKAPQVAPQPQQGEQDQPGRLARAWQFVTGGAKDQKPAGLASKPTAQKWSDDDKQAAEYFTTGKGRSDPRSKIVLENLKSKYGRLTTNA